MTGDSKPSAEDMDAAIAALSQHGDPLRPYQVEAVAKAIADAVNREPIPMVLHCPSCGAQHIDAPEPENGWDNPPHRSHSCHTCKTVWRPADVATTGVTAIATRGSADNWTGFTVGDAFRNADEALNCEIERRREAEAQSLPEIIVTPLAKLQDLDPASVIALADVAQERLRQINGEGWTATHDDVEHQAG